MVRLYEERMRTCAEVGEYKILNGKKVFDRQREREKIAAVLSQTEGELNKKGVQELFELAAEEAEPGCLYRAPGKAGYEY